MRVQTRSMIGRSLLAAMLAAVFIAPAAAQTPRFSGSGKLEKPMAKSADGRFTATAKLAAANKPLVNVRFELKALLQSGAISSATTCFGGPNDLIFRDDFEL